jgi:two-component system chemotaxis response regulator CheY
MEKFDTEDVVVLVVDDDKVTTGLLNRLLTVMGAKEIIVARDGAEGLRTAFEKKPSLIVCDIGMKPVDGMAFLGGLKSSNKPDIARIPVVMFSSAAEPEAMERATALGAGGYMIKPFNPNGFATELKAVLAKSAAAGEA